MPLTYSREPSGLQPYQFSDDEMLWIGKLICACAELEDIAHCYACKMIGLTYALGLIMFNRMAVSGRLQIAQKVALTKDPRYAALHAECFGNEDYSDIIKCRNTVAHGALLGKTDKGEMAFQVQGTEEVGEDTVFADVIAYEPGDFKDYAEKAERLIPLLEKKLKLQSWRGIHRVPSLAPHRKTLRRKRQRAKRERQPPPSQA